MCCEYFHIITYTSVIVFFVKTHRVSLNGHTAIYLTNSEMMGIYSALASFMI